MKRFEKYYILFFLFFIIPLYVFGDATKDEDLSFSKMYKGMFLNSQSTVPYEYDNPSNSDWGILKSFISTMLSAETISGNNEAKSFITLQKGEITSSLKDGTTYYYCKNVSLSTAFNQDVFVENLNGHFSYDSKSSVIEAHFSAIFPFIDSNVHKIKVEPSTKNGKLEYFIVNLDEKTFKIDRSKFFMMMLGGFEFAIECVFR